MGLNSAAGAAASLAERAAQSNAVAPSQAEAPYAEAPHAEAPRLSQLLWGIEWSELLPCEMSAGVQVRWASPEVITQFIASNYGDIFGDAEQEGYWRDPSTARAHYLRHVCDTFAFHHEDRVVGIFISNPVDWSTYYIRSVAFLPEYQGLGLVQHLTEFVGQRLSEYGVVRIEADTALSNHQCVAALLKQKFVASGTAISERWGALSKFTKFLDPAAESAYLARFCASGVVHRRQRERTARAL
jgi:hypothetical protein